MAKGAADRAVLARRQAFLAQYERLTPREREVLGHLIKRLINRQVAAQLNITERTVKVHRAQILQKLQVDSIAALAGLRSRSASNRQRRSACNEPWSAGQRRNELLRTAARGRSIGCTKGQ